MKQRTDDNAAARASTISSLKKLGFTYTAAVKLYDAYEDEAESVVTDDPYRIAIEIPGIGFKTADAIAAAVAAKRGSPAAVGDIDHVGAAEPPLGFEHRTAAGILYILARYAAEGHTCVPRGKLTERAIALMDVASDDVDDSLFSLFLDGRASEALIDGLPCIFLDKYLRAERSVCSDLMRLMSSEPRRLYADPGDLIDRSEASLGIELSAEQRGAVTDSLQSGVFVVTGGPGTGKTTIIRAVIDILEHAGMKIAVAAPTGRAAKRVTEATGHKASTIHRLLEYYYDENAREMYFGKNANNKLDREAVIIDEASMVDALLMEALLAAIKSGSRLIIVGDADQLPPVGAGDVLRDILESGCVPSAVLTEIYRQAAESMIVVNAHRIDRGEYPAAPPDGGESDFIIEERRTGADALSTILNLYSSAQPNAAPRQTPSVAPGSTPNAAPYPALAAIPGLTPIRDMQTLTPMKKGLLGCANLNKELQAVLNPPSPSKAERKYGERVFREGDRVMQTRNNYSLEWVDSADGSEGRGVFNGDMGIVKDIDAAAATVTVAYDDTKYATYGADGLMEIEHAYAITVHKSQGSEFPVVIIPVYAAAPVLMTRNLIYTAVTRGKSLVILVGATERLKQMIDNAKGRARHSGLKSFLIEYSSKIDAMSDSNAMSDSDAIR
ncbi:MAG: AAA family ATPase [Clostridiales Family XIII bacterium]|jgi:exodeoxyribonuclease V alpha subunit|nr:AAA family ATPase [Clostridiales Family XIII bacterium]